MRLMAGQTAHRGDGLGGQVSDIRYRMVLCWVPDAILQGQNRDFSEVIPGQLHFPVEDRHLVFLLQLFWLTIRAVTLQAQLVHILRPQQLGVFATVRLVADRATLCPDWLMHMGLFQLLRSFLVAIQTSCYRIGPDVGHIVAAMRAMADRAVLFRAIVRNLGDLDIMRGFLMAGPAYIPGTRRRQYDLALFRGKVAAIAGSRLEGTVEEGPHEFGPAGLVGIVALQAVALVGLALVSFDKLRILGIVTIETKSRDSFGQVVPELTVWLGVRFVNDVARVTTPI